MTGKDYRKRMNQRHYLDCDIEQAYEAGKSSMGRDYCLPSDQGIIKQLQQLMRVTFDGDVMGKSLRDELVAMGFAQRFNCWNWITKDGIAYLEKLNFIHP